MKQSKKVLLSLALAFLIVFTSSEIAIACTGFIIGSDLTEDGNFIFGRTEDLEVNHNKRYKVYPQGTYPKGHVIKDVSYDENLGYEYEFKQDSYQFTGVPDTTPEYGIFDEAGFNEKGLVIDMTVSMSPNDAVNNVDPLLDGSDSEKNIGITEAIMSTVVLATQDNVVDAIKFIADEVATKGNAEGNGFVIADNTDLWYMELYTGHQFVAMRYPTDKFSVFPNTFWLNELTLTKGMETKNYIISEDGNYIYSKGIFDVAKKAGTFVGDEHKNIINLAKSYGPESIPDSSRSRVASGILHLNPEASVTLDSEVFEFLQESNNKISLSDVMSLTRNRLDTVDVEADDLGKGIQYPIGNRNVMEAHIFHMNSTNPKEYPGIMWLSMGASLISPYIAYYPNQTRGIDAVQVDTNEYDEKSYYWTVMDILHMVETDRDNLQAIVDAKVQPLQKEFLENETITAMNSSESTDKNMQDAQKTFDILKEVQQEVHEKYVEYLNNNDYSAKFLARRSTKAFAGSSISVKKGTSEDRLSLKINPNKKIMTLTDYFGNPVKSLNKAVKFSIPVSAFNLPVKFMVNDKFIEANKVDDFYVFESNEPMVKFTSDFEETEKEMFTITFDANEGAIKGEKTLTIEAKKGETIIIPEVDTREGYVLDYWEGSVYHPGDAYIVEGDHTFTAKWKEAETTSEKPSETETKEEEKINVTEKETKKENKDKNTNPITGDNFRIVYYLAILILAVVALIVLNKKRKNSK